MQYFAHNAVERFQALFKRDHQQTGSIFRDIKKDTNTIAVLDGVRAIAALAVLAFHLNILNGRPPWDMAAWPLMSAIATFGGSGVTLFFILSGFLLFLPYVRGLLFETKWPATRDFYLRRALRILPGYYVALFLMIILFHPEYFRVDHLPQLLLFATFFMDSTAQTFRQLNGPFWTLAIEWQFYMLLPLLAVGFRLLVTRLATSPPRRLMVVLACCLGVIVWGLGIRYVGLYYQEHATATLVVPRQVLNVVLFFLYGEGGKYLESFAVGMFICACYVFAQHGAWGGALSAWLRRHNQWFWYAGLLILLFTAGWHFNVLHYHGWPFAYLDPLTPIFNWLNEMVIAAGYGACIIAILFNSGRLRMFFEWRFLRWIGLISFGIYMWHLPLLYFFQSQILPVFPPMEIHVAYLATWLWVIVFIIPVGFCSYALVEEPWMRLRRRLGRKAQKALSSGEQAQATPAVARIPERV